MKEEGKGVWTMSAKKKVYVIAFSHLDLFWGGSREECLSRGCRVLSTALSLLEEHPEYRFLVESVNFLETFLDCFPEQTERVRKLVREKCLEVIPMRAILYTLLPSGETTIRNLLSGMKFCREKLGSVSSVMSLSDIPGVTPQLPQIARLAGISEIVLSRGFREHTDHVLWTGLDGTSVAAYCPWHYANLSCTFAGGETAELQKGLQTFRSYFDAVDYPQIFHWGMDLYVLTESVFQTVKKLNALGEYEFHFMTFREFFDTFREVPRKALSGENPNTWPHIESSWPDLWPLDLPAERAMYNAELLGSLSRLAGFPDDDPPEEMERAWQRLLDSMDHNQNGIGGEMADADKLRLKQSAMSTADTRSERCFRRLIAHTTAPHENAAPIVVFNPLSWKRSGMVRGRTACYGTPFATIFRDGWISAHHYEKTPPQRFRLVDSEGREIAYHLETHRMYLADTVELSFFAEDVPAFGCKVYYVEMLEKGTEAPSPFSVYDDRAEDLHRSGRYLESDRVENRFFRLEVARLTGEFSLYDKVNGRMLLDHAAILGLEERRGEYIYQMELSGRTIPAVIDSVEITENNAVFCRVEIRGSVYEQPFVQHLTLSADSPELEIENTIEWRGRRYVRLEQSFPFVSAETAEIRYGVPFGAVRFPESVYQPDGKVPDETKQQDPAWNIRLVRDWVDISDRLGGATIAADHRMWTFQENTLRNCMIRGIGWTSGGVHLREDGTQEAVQRPPAGTYHFRFRIRPHGSGEGICAHLGWELNTPMQSGAVATGEVSPHPGLRLPKLPETTGSSVIVSCVKPAENRHGILVRCFESMGKRDRLSLPRNAGWRWVETDLLEAETREIESDTLDFRPFEIKTLLWIPGSGRDSA